jgi:hypothetical protein
MEIQMNMRIPQQVPTNRRLKGKAIFLLLVVLLTSYAHSLSAQPCVQGPLSKVQGPLSQFDYGRWTLDFGQSSTKTQTKASQPTQSSLREALQKSFGAAVGPVTAFKPYYLTGDFNGDGAQDILIVVRIKGPRAELASDVTLYNPFERPKPVFPANPSANPTLAFAIIHGNKPGWQTASALEKFLMFGESPVLILNYSRVTSTESQDKQSLMELLRKRSVKFKADGWPPAAAKGDSIVLGTEATDSILYWNGKNYRWEEAAGAE